MGTSTHLGMELFKSMTGIQIVHVPYKGGAQSSADLVGGQVQLVITNLPEQINYIKAGRTRALGSRRSSARPSFPTCRRSPKPACRATTSLFGTACAAGIERTLLEKLKADLIKAVTSPETTKRLTDVGIEPAPGTSERFTAFARAEVAKWAQVTKDAGVSAD